jgi:hypothetical protein
VVSALSGLPNGLVECFNGIRRAKGKKTPIVTKFNRQDLLQADEWIEGI